MRRSREGFSNLIEELFEPLANDVSFQVRAASLESLGAVIAELGRDRASESLVDHFVSMAESAGGRASCYRQRAHSTFQASHTPLDAIAGENFVEHT